MTKDETAEEETTKTESRRDKGPRDELTERLCPADGENVPSTSQIRGESRGRELEVEPSRPPAKATVSGPERLMLGIRCVIISGSNQPVSDSFRRPVRSRGCCRR